MLKHSTKIKVLGLILGFTGHFVELKAGEIYITVTDVEGTPLEDAVVSATLLTTAGKIGSVKQSTDISANKQFTPLVTAVEVGTAISFPNRDDILHKCVFIF